MIKRRFQALIPLLLVFIQAVFPQPVSVSLQAPDVITAGQEAEVVLNLKKGNLEGFARLQQNFPAGIEVLPRESAYADFAFDAGKLNLIWLKLPADPEIRISYLVKADPAVQGSFVLGGKFSYLVNNNRNDLDLDSKSIRILPAPGMDASKIVDIKDYVASGAAKTVTTGPARETVPPPATTRKEELPVAYRQEPLPLSQGEGYRVNVLLGKGNWEKAGILEEDILNAFEARALDTKGARFSFEAGKARFVWMKMPADPYLFVSYELVPRVSGHSSRPSIQGKFSLVEGNTSNQVSVSQRSFSLESTDPVTLASLAGQLRIPEGEALTTQKPPAGDAGQATDKPDVTVTPQTQQAVQTTPSPAVKGIVFRVQVGAFTQAVNMETYFRKMNLQEEVMMDRHNGLYKYTVGNFKSYQDARNLRDRVARTTLVDVPFVCAFRDGSRIPVDEALRLTNQQWIR